MTDGPSYPSYPGDSNRDPNAPSSAGADPGAHPGNYPPPPPGSDPLTPGSEPFSIGNAFSYAWSKFKENAGAIIVATLVVIVASLVIQAIGEAVNAGVEGGTTTFGDPSDVTVTGFFVSGLVSILAGALSYIFTAALIRGSLDITEGEKFNLGAAFKKLDIAKVVITAFLVSVLTTIGFLLLVIPGIIVAIFTAFALYFAVDSTGSAVDAIKSSVGLVKDNFGPVFLLILASIATMIVGLLALIVGVLVAIPILTIVWAYAFKTFQGKPVH